MTDDEYPSFEEDSGFIAYPPFAVRNQDELLELLGFAEEKGGKK
jgi:hypothetical protein